MNRKDPAVKIKGSVVLVTGANRGIGKAYAEEFLKAGAAKVYLGVRDLNSMKEFAAAHPGKLVPVLLDVTNEDHIRKAAETAKDVTILVNNAGVLYGGALLDGNLVENARHEMEVNYFGPMAMTRAFANILKSCGGGAIVNVSSIAGFVAFPGLPTYCPSKAALHYLTIATRAELSAQGTHVLGVYPGPIDTDMARGFDMAKASPNSVAVETIRALETGEKTLMPDAYAQELYALWRKGPKFAMQKLRGVSEAA